MLLDTSAQHRTGGGWHGLDGSPTSPPHTVTVSQHSFFRTSPALRKVNIDAILHGR
jgi:hypothetical protein